MCKKVVIFALLFLIVIPIREVSNAMAYRNPEKDIIFKYIKTLSPNIDSSIASQLSSQYLYLCDKYNIDPKIFVSIAFQENSFNLSGVNHRDAGHMQVNYYWHVKKKGLKITFTQLDSDWKLNTTLAAEYLSECRSKVKGDKFWWTCYHSYRKDDRQEYKKLAGRHFSILEKL